MFNPMSQHCCKVLHFNLFLSTLLGAGGAEELTESMKWFPESRLLSFTLLLGCRIFKAFSFCLMVACTL